MKRIVLVISLFFVFVWAGSAFATGSSCTQTGVTKSGAQASLTFTCTASSVDNSFPTGGTSITNSVNTAAIRGYYITEVLTSPGGTAPTDGTAVALNTGDSPAWDTLGAVGVCSSTITKRFAAAAVTLPSGALVQKTIDTTLTVAITGNSVPSAIVKVKIILWNN
jgi:hypothetical protein